MTVIGTPTWDVPSGWWNAAWQPRISWPLSGIYFKLDYISLVKVKALEGDKNHNNKKKHRPNPRASQTAAILAKHEHDLLKKIIEAFWSNDGVVMVPKYDGLVAAFKSEDDEKIALARIHAEIAPIKISIKPWKVDEVLQRILNEEACTLHRSLFDELEVEAEQVRF